MQPLLMSEESILVMFFVNAYTASFLVFNMELRCMSMKCIHLYLENLSIRCAFCTKFVKNNNVPMYDFSTVEWRHLQKQLLRPQNCLNIFKHVFKSFVLCINNVWLLSSIFKSKTSHDSKSVFALLNSFINFHKLNVIFSS